MNAIKKYFLRLNRLYFSRMQKKQKIYFSVFACIVLILFWAFLSAGFITHNFNRAVLKGNSEKQEVGIKSMILTESKEGEKSWEIYGETGEYSSDHRVAILYNVVGNFYKDNKVNMSFQSSKGSYNEETRDIELYDNTYIVLENGVSVIADHVTYHSDERTINAEGNVKINQAGKFISISDEAYVNSDFTIFEIKGNTSTRIYQDKNSEDSKNTKGI